MNDYLSATANIIILYNLLSFISSGSVLTGTSSTAAGLKFIPCKGN